MKKLSKELPLSILIAEDNYINQKLLLDVLATQGYKCDAVSNGFEVIETVQKKNYDLILMDIQMPGMSGEETMKQVREMKKAESPKIIAVTPMPWPMIGPNSLKAAWMVISVNHSAWMS